MTVCKRVISVMMCVAVIIGTMISANLSAKAESGSELMPGTINDLSFTNIVRSYLSVCEGGYMRVYVDKNYVEKKDYTEFKTVYIEWKSSLQYQI